MGYESSIKRIKNWLKVHDKIVIKTWIGFSVEGTITNNPSSRQQFIHTHSGVFTVEQFCYAHNVEEVELVKGYFLVENEDAPKSVGKREDYASDLEFGRARIRPFPDGIYMTREGEREPISEPKNDDLDDCPF